MDKLLAKIAQLRREVTGCKCISDQLIIEQKIASLKYAISIMETG